MALTDANVAIVVGGDTSALRKDLKKGTASLNKFGGDARKAMTNVAKMGAAAAVAAAAVAGALYKAATDSAAEIDKLSRIAGVSSKSFQEMAFGAKKFGIEQDKLSDILKDTNDKVGDFLQTGGGAMADYFENIAPLVGQTAEQFKGLSGPEALQKYVNGLEAANLSQAEMTFYMEAIASDSTLLLPLLRENGKEFSKAAEEIDRFGGALTDIEVEQLNQAHVSFKQTAALIKNVLNKAMAGLSPIIEVISQKLKDGSADAFDFANIGTKAFTAVAKAVGYVGNVFRGLHVVFKGINIVFQGMIAGITTGLLKFSEFNDKILSNLVDRINLVISGLNKLPKVDISEIIIGESEMTQKLRDINDVTVGALKQTIADTHELLLEPMPTETVTNFLNEVKAASEEHAKAVVDAKNAMSSGGGGSEAEDNKARFDAQKQFLQNKYQAEAEINQKILDDHKKTVEEQKKIDRERFNNTLTGFSGMFKNLSSLMDTENKKMFEIGKAAAIAGAVVDGIKAAIGAYKVGAGIGGPITGAAFAGASAISTGVMINNLRKQSFGGGGGGGNASAGADAGGVPSVQNNTSISSAPNINFSVTGGLDSNAADQIIDYLKKDGVLFGRDSYQASLLR